MKKNYEFIDVHCHLESCKDIEKIVKKAKEENIIILSAGTDVKNNREVLELASKYENVLACLGFYPIDVENESDGKIDEEINFIKKNKSKISAISEVGLDLHYGKNIVKQKIFLEKFVKLAKELNLPLIIHSREAELETIQLLEKTGYKKIVMHCFSGNMKLVKRIVENGWFLSIPASVKYSEHFQKVVVAVPIKNLLCETDSPFLHPEKQKNNTPLNVIESYKKISEIKNLKLEETRKIINDNFSSIFKV